MSLLHFRNNIVSVIIIIIIIINYTCTLTTAQTLNDSTDAHHLQVAGTASAPLGGQYFGTAVIDTESSAAYFGTAGQQNSRVCKYKTSPKLSFVSCILAPPSVAYFSFTASVLDAENGFAYFATSNTDSVHESASQSVCQVDVRSSSQFSFVSCIYTPHEVLMIQSAIVHDSVGYFGTNSYQYLNSTSFGQICKFSLPSSSSSSSNSKNTFSFITCISSPYLSASGFNAAVVDVQHSFAYFAGVQRVCRINVSSSSNNFLDISSCIEGPSNLDSGFTTASIDATNMFLYLTADNIQGICKIDISPQRTFEFVSCIKAGMFAAIVSLVDIPRSVLYIVDHTSPPSICAFDISPSKPFSHSPSSCTSKAATSGIVTFGSGIIDTQTSRLFFGSDSRLAAVYEMDVSDSSSFPNSLKFTKSVPALGVGELGFGFIDSQREFAYYLSEDGQVKNLCIFNISSTNFDFVTCVPSEPLSDHSNTNVDFGISSVVFDDQSSVVLFGTFTNDNSISGKLCKFAVGSSVSDVRFVSCITAPASTSTAYNYYSAAVDTANSVSYFAISVYSTTDLPPCTVCKVSTASTAALAIGTCVNFPKTTVGVSEGAVIDTEHSYAYFTAHIATTFQDTICKVDVSPSRFAFVSCLLHHTTAIGSLSQPVLDIGRFFIYYVRELGSYYGICTLDLTTFSFTLPCLNISTDVTPMGYSVIDAQYSRMYSVCGDGVYAQKICTFDISSPTPKFVSALNVSSSLVGLRSSSSLVSAAIDPQHNALYFGVSVPPQMIKVDLNVLQCGRDGHLTLNALNSSSRPIIFDALHCRVFVSNVVASYFVFQGEISDSNITFQNVTCSSKSSVCIVIANAITSASSFELISVSFNQQNTHPQEVSSFIRLGVSSSQVRFDAPVKFTLEKVAFSGTELVSTAAKDIDLSSSTWSFKCNDFHHGYNHQFEGFARQHNIQQLTFDCARTQSISLSMSLPCTSLDEISCTNSQSTYCKFCSEINLCLPTEVSCESSCQFLDKEYCVGSTCHFCSEYGTCVNSTVVPQCDCEFFNETSCPPFKCKWCDSINTCTVSENTNCECYYLKTNAQCSPTSTNNACSWCSTSDPTSRTDPTAPGAEKQPMHVFNVVNDFNYCVNRTSDSCNCDYLSNDFCKFASSYYSNTSNDDENVTRHDRNYSSTCKYCPNLDLCTRAEENSDCQCGLEYSPRGCSLSPTCRFEPAVLTITDGNAYCAPQNSTNPACSPVACRGITDPFACNASGCTYNTDVRSCETKQCFNFFISGFTMQPYALYFFGLFKDVVVVLLVGAFGDYLTRPIMEAVVHIKKKIKKWDHIERRIGPDTLYMLDRICRDGYSFSFAEYVEQICEDVFEFTDADGKRIILEEKQRLALFDITAFCLFDNMLWIEPSHAEEEDGEVLPQEREIDTFSVAASSIAEKKADNDNEEISSQNKSLKDSQKEVTAESPTTVVPETVQEETLEKKENSPPSTPKQKENEKETEQQDQPPLEEKLIQDSEASLQLNTTNSSQQALSTYSPPNCEDQTDNDDQKQQRVQSAPATPTERTSRISLADPSKENNINAEKDGDSKDDDDLTADEIEQSPKKIDCSRLLNSNADFDINKLTTLVQLRTEVQDALLARATSFVFYAQSRNRIVSACAAINSFPSSLQLLCYITVVTVLYVTSFITVSKFPSISQVVTGCNSFTHEQTGLTFYGGFLLLGFRLMNSSAEATSVLIFVKTIRGLYQKYTGLHDLSLQQRIPLLGLFADRPIQITLSIYALIILPFALAGPLFGGTRIDWRCWVPILVGAAVILTNWGVLFGIRYYARERRVAYDQEKNMNSVQQQATANDDGGAVEADDDDEYDFIVDDARFLETESGISLLSTGFKTGSTTSKSLRKKTPRESYLVMGDDPFSSELYENDTMAAAAPTRLGKAILIFLLTEEVPVISVSLALQVSFNYLCLLRFKDAFGIADGNGVYYKDYNDRKLECVWDAIEKDTSAMMSMLSSFIPF